VSGFHRSGQTPSLPRVPDTGPAGEDNLCDGARVYRLAPDGGLSVLANCEYPNGLALSPDERTMYVANTRASQYIHAIHIDEAGNMVGRGIFADLNEGSEPGIPDGLKVDSIGRVYCTGPGGIWVMAPDGRCIGVIRWPEQAVNFAFGGPDLRTLFCCAHTSVYTLRVKVPGKPHPWYKRRGSNLTTPAAAASQAGQRRCRAPAPPRARSQAAALPH
jgi:gluconolactonase